MQRVLRLAEVRRVTGLSTSSIYAMAAAGRFPKQISLSTRLVAWSEQEINEWLNARIALRDQSTRVKTEAA